MPRETNSRLLKMIVFELLCGRISSVNNYAFCHSLGGGGGFTRPIPRDRGADQFRGIPIVGRPPRTGPEVQKRRGVAENGPTKRV